MCDRSVLRSVVGSIIALLLFGTGFSHGAEWYAEQPYRCQDPLDLYPIFLSPHTNWFTRTSEFKLQFPSVSQGLSYAEVVPEYFASLQEAGLAGHVAQTMVLDTAKAASIRNFLKARAEEDIPFILQIAINLALGPTGIFGGTTMDYLKSIKETGKMSAATLAGLIAVGGQMIRFHYLQYDTKGRPFLVEDFRYQVSVGKEARQYVLASCKWAATPGIANKPKP
ncbi:hypothetical protein SG09_38280 [Bradyrhizobium ottawaense]|uniref:hypothetical protein n=1 Tax=Bradyrhizobium ottawaense TaxID=931866 RepID=UPI001260A1C1|nr:hypothetical protein [Bradyrhizobium ottawaense]BBO04478.1 hypothetical protein SG09_38280 [Bradyrhizobium ottawaense]